MYSLYTSRFFPCDIHLENIVDAVVEKICYLEKVPTAKLE